MRVHPIVQRVAWPTCLLTNLVPMVLVATYAPQWLPQAAGASTVALAVALVVAEQLATHRPDWSTADDADIWRDIGHILSYAAAVTIARLLFLGAMAQALARWGVLDILQIWPSRWPMVTQILLVIVLGDLLEYGFHRMSHALPSLWRLHALHHTPVRLNVLKGGRHHLLYAFVRGIVVWTPLLVLGAPADLVYWQFIAITMAGLPAHANVRFLIPAPMHRVLVTPQFHRIHHAADPNLSRTNYAVVLPVWDLLFGTHSDPLRVKFWQAGIRDDPIPRRFADELASPFTSARPVARRAMTERNPPPHDSR